MDDLSWLDEFCEDVKATGLYIPKCNVKLQEHNFSFKPSQESFFNLILERCPGIYITDGEIEDILDGEHDVLILVDRNRENNRHYNEEKEMEYKPEEG